MFPLLPSRRSLALLLLAVWLMIAIPLAVFTRPATAAAISPYDLIAAVNELRAARGLAPLAVNSSLMTAAQNHSLYQASIGAGTHVGPGNTHPLDRARAAGYGGGNYIAVAENITSYKENTPDILTRVMTRDWNDDLHMNTMLNTSLQHVGAGVAIANGIVYLTLDTGWVAGPASPTQALNGTLTIRSPLPTTIPIVALVISTPSPDGSIVHVVGYGQVLINIVAAYGVKPAEIVAWNGINPDAIYAGQRLLVRLPSTKTPAGRAALNPTSTASSSPILASSATPHLPTATEVVVPTLLSAQPAESSIPALPASIRATPTPLPPAESAQQPSPTQIAILVTIACGVLGVLLVSLRKN